MVTSNAVPARPNLKAGKSEEPAQVLTTREDELLHLFARQVRRTVIPVLLVPPMIFVLAFNRVALGLLIGWWVLYILMLLIRYIVVTRLPTLATISTPHKLQVTTAVAAASGCVNALSLSFFPYLTEPERAAHTMIFVALCAGSAATTGGYAPVYLAYMLPMLVPLTILWGFGIGFAHVGTVELLMAGMIGLLILWGIVVAKEASRLSIESFAARAQLQVALEQAEAASRAKTRFLASASHDLRQPIHTVSLFGAALSMRPLETATREIVQHMNTAVQTLAAQLDALLDISKLDAKVMRVEPARIRPCDILARLRRDLEPAARAKGLTLTLDCPDQGFIETDPLLFERVIRNLLDNAIKYTDKGHVGISVNRMDGYFTISVEDTGCGIPKAEQTRVFEEFYQLDNPERDRSRGMGLGLPIVKRLTELLKIRLDMESVPGGGTKFHLRLPASEYQPKNATLQSAVRTIPNALRVLVVDDEAEVRLGMRTLLEGMACSVTLADGTADAVDQARAYKPDVVLCDLRLRGTDNGIETVRAVRKLYPAMPALLISGDIAPDRLREAEAAGIPLLHKPVPLDVLKQEIAKVLG